MIKMFTLPSGSLLFLLSSCTGGTEGKDNDNPAGSPPDSAGGDSPAPDTDDASGDTADTEPLRLGWPLGAMAPAGSATLTELEAVDLGYDPKVGGYALGWGLEVEGGEGWLVGDWGHRRDATGTCLAAVCNDDAYLYRFRADDVLGGQSASLASDEVDTARVVAVSGSNAYVVGRTAGDLDGSASPLDGTQKDGFIARFDGTTLDSVSNYGSDDFDELVGGVLGEAGLWVSGGSWETPCPATEGTLGDENALVQLLGQSGERACLTFGTPKFEETLSIAVGEQGVFVSGMTTADWATAFGTTPGSGPWVMGETMGLNDGYVARLIYDAAADTLSLDWVVQLGAVGDDAAQGVALGWDGDTPYVYVSGRVEGKLMDSAIPDEPNDAYVVGIPLDPLTFTPADPAQPIGWSAEFGGEQGDGAQTMLFSQDRLFVTGTRDGGTVKNGPPSGEEDGYLVAFTPSGEPTCTWIFEDSEDRSSSFFEIDEDTTTGWIYLVGSITQTHFVDDPTTEWDDTPITHALLATITDRTCAK